LYFDGDRNAVLEEHAKISDAVILAPAMHEGLDLKDDLGRFQIICKVPYPSKGDPQVSARMELSPMYYDWRTMTKLIQSCGRIIRHSEDHGKTYVLDEDFKRFMDRNSKLVPKWFAKSIIW
jgi:Rad3-related DNA helicase